jgi:hypothetical protein
MPLSHFYIFHYTTKITLSFPKLKSIVKFRSLNTHHQSGCLCTIFKCSLIFNFPIRNESGKSADFRSFRSFSFFFFYVFRLFRFFRIFLADFRFLFLIGFDNETLMMNFSPNSKFKIWKKKLKLAKQKSPIK